MKKKKIVIYNFCYLKLRPTKSNIFVTLTDFNGQVILKSSAGIINFSGKKKSTNFVVESVVKDLIIKLKKKKIKINVMVVQLYGFIRQYSFTRSIKILNKFKIKSFIGIIDIVKYAHNGMRLKKMKRL